MVSQKKGQNLTTKEKGEDRKNKERIGPWMNVLLIDFTCTIQQTEFAAFWTLVGLIHWCTSVKTIYGWDQMEDSISFDSSFNTNVFIFSCKLDYLISKVY